MTGQIKKGFQPQLPLCKNKKGEITGETNELVRRLRGYCAELLNGPDHEPKAPPLLEVDYKW
jgi:hypothetical protein